jgi:hypothetical protein
MSIRTVEPVTLTEPPPRKPSPWWSLAATIAITVLLGLGAWLFAPSGLGEIAPPPDLASYSAVDGVVSEVNLPVVVLNAYAPVDGRTRLRFEVRAADQRYFDVVHLRAHSSIGLPTRIYYEDDGERLWAVYKEDAPANSGGDG